MSANVDTLAALSEHKGACQALLAAARLLRKCGQYDAAVLVLENVDNLVPAPEPLPKLPQTWPFPKDAPEALI